MSKILVEYERISPTLDLTIDIINRFIDVYGGELTKKRIDEIRKSDFASNDVVLSIRGNSKGAYYVAKTAKKNGLFYCLLMDDDLFDTPPFYRYNGRIKYANKIAKISDAVIVFNRFVGDLCKERFGSRCIQLDTICDIDDIHIAKDDNKKLTKIVFAANIDHNLAFEKYITPVLKNVERKASTNIQFDFICVSPRTDTELMTVNYYTLMPMDKYRAFMKNGQYDLGIAIVEDNYFSNCKYINKFLEYTMNDVVGIFTNCSLYNHVIENGVNGFLTENTSDCWEETLLYAINNPKIVNQCLENAKYYLIQNHSPLKIIEGLSNDLPELVNYKAHVIEVKGVWKIRFSFLAFLFIEKCCQAFHHLMKGGIYELYQKLIQKIKNNRSYYDKKGAQK